jgi:site-specific recombinase XerD
MAKASVILRTHTKNADGYHPIWLRFTDSKRTLYHSLGVYVHERHWNDRKSEVRKGHDHADRINALIARRLSEVEDERLRLATEREPITAAALKAAVVIAPVPASTAGCFLAYVRDRLDALEKSGNVDRHKNDRAVFRKLAAFATGSSEAGIDLEGRSLPFERITTAFLRDLHGHLMGSTVGNNAATANKNLKRIGTYYRAAQAEGVAPPGVDPWAGYKPTRETEVERAKLSAAELAALASLSIERDSMKEAVRDAFLFSVYTAGIRFSDMARLRCRDIGAETDAEGQRRLRLTYAMGKNGKSVSSRLPVPAARLVVRYMTRDDGTPKKGDAFLFPFLDGYDLSTPDAYRSARGSRNATYNSLLKEIAAEAGVSKSLSSHVARHTFADLTRREGWDTYDTSKALRHHSLSQTQTYLARSDDAKLDGLLDNLFPGDDE